MLNHSSTNRTPADGRQARGARRPFLLPSVALLLAGLMCIFAGAASAPEAPSAALPLAGLGLALVAGLLARVRRPTVAAGRMTFESDGASAPAAANP